ncbi:MAG: hypothetical protein IPM36_24310 [Lewinellaceae bacterium]|nr:hypothetical protein [Lewinellaceae bacterium]
MDKLTYNQQMENSLNSKHPVLLFPVRLETRYVHTGSIYSPLEEALNETLIQVNIAGNNILTPFKPSEIFNAGTTVIDRIETIARELETLEKAQFAAPAFYKISLLDSRLSSFATKSIQLLGDAHAAMRANQAAIDRQVAESGQFVRLRQDPEAPALPYVLNKRLEKAAGEISEAVSHPEDIDLLSATALLQRQKKLLELLAGYRSAIAGLHSVNAEDQRALKARNQRLLSLARAWNAATEPAITKYESAAELLNQKFAGAKDRVAGFQTAYVEPAGFGNLSAVWKKIDRYKTETEAVLTTGKPATGTPATLVQEMEALKMLGNSLESVEVQSLDPVVLQDLALALAAGHQQTQDASAQGAAGHSRNNALFTLLQAQVAQLEQAMHWDDCGDGAGISEQTWENLKRLKIQLEAALADVDDLQANDTEALHEALLQLTEAAADILEELNGLSIINCADCPGLEATVQHLPAALAQCIPRLEMLLSELKRQEGLANELLDQIKNQIHALSEKYLTDRFAFLKQLQDLQFLLDTLHSAGTHQPTTLVLDQVAQINEKMGSLLLEIPGLERLPAGQIYQAAAASGAVDAIALYEELLHDRQGRLDSLCSDIDFYIDQLNKCLDKQPSNCNSALAPVLQPEIEFLIEKIKQSEAQLNHCGGAETAFILSVQEYITKTVSSILIHIARQHLLDEKDVEQIRQLISQLTEALHSCKDKIMSAEKAESRAFKKWKEIRQLLIKKNAELEQLMQIEQKAPDWFLVLKTHTTLRLYSQAPALFSMETRLSFSGQLMRTGQVYERQLEGIRNLPQNQKPTLLRELNAALNALKTAPDNLPDSYPRTAATLETLAGQLGQFRFPEIRENGQAEAETDTSAVLKNIIDAQEALLRLRLCNRNYIAIQQAAAVLARQFTLLKQVLSTYKPRTGSSLAQVQSALERLLAHYREWERPNKSFLQQAGQSAQNLWENRQILLRTGTSLIDRLVSMPVSEAAQEETPPPGNQSGSRGKRASKDIKLPVWSYQIIPGLWELWIRIFPDEIAIDYHDPAFTSDELEAGKVYWRTIWDEPDGPALQEVKMGLWRSLVLRFGEQRAAYIIRTLEPTETIPQDNPIDAQAKTGGPPVTQVVTQLVFPEVSIKETAWSKAPVSYVMPDRFVFALYETEDSAPDLHFGADTVPDVLVAGIDPSDDDALEEAPNGELRVGPELKWTVDFSDAVAKGMAIQIKLSGPDQAFAKIVALGLKTRTVKNADLIEHSRALLEKLFTGHHYAPGGMAFVPPGTPTNNTSDGDAAYSMFNEDSASFQTELTGDTFTLAADKAQKADGQVLAEALGLDPALFQHMHQAGGFSSRNAGVMNYCLWQTTLGYFLEEMFAFYQTGDHLFNTLTYDKVDNKDLLQNLDAIRDYMATHVTGRGALPSIRVGDQPYGFLPIGVYHQSEYRYLDPMYATEPTLLERPFFDESGDESGLMNAFISGYGGLFNWNDQFSATFCRNLLNVLLGMKAKWLQAARQIQTVDDPLGADEAADPTTKQQIANDRFMRILGLHAHAQTYDNRYSVGTDDAALKNQIFPDNGFTETQLLGYKGLFFTVPQNYWMTVLDWNWARNFTINGTNTQFNDNAGYLTIAHLRHLDFPIDKPNTMQGFTVDALKASEKRLLSKISETSSQNYIDWLVQSPIKSVLKATIEGSMPSKSLLYLLLSNSYLNYAWDAGMRIYSNLGNTGSGVALRENVFARLPRLLFPTWSFVGSTWSQVKSYVDGLYPDQEKQRLAADVLNFVIDSQKLYGNTNTLLSFQINAAHKLGCQHQNDTDTTSNLTNYWGTRPFPILPLEMRWIENRIMRLLPIGIRVSCRP